VLGDHHHCVGFAVLSEKRVVVKNRLLAALPRASGDRLLTKGKWVELVFADVLCEVGERIRYVYFPESGLISLLARMGGKQYIEVGMVGSEGMAGVSPALGVSVSPLRMLVQGSGVALQVDAAIFISELKRDPALQNQIKNYLHSLLVQVSQTAACNRVHELEPRLARWLLMTQDRMRSNDFFLTQEFLAAMLGVRRAGVTEAAGVFQKKKLIRYTRGNITVMDRAGLRRMACRCYGTIDQVAANAP
jgi:CRP-like cAMP-binding protein